MINPTAGFNNEVLKNSPGARSRYFETLSTPDFVDMCSSVTPPCIQVKNFTRITVQLCWM